MDEQKNTEQKEEKELWEDGAWKAHDLLKQEFEPVQQIVEGIVEAGTLTVFAGAPKAGKSFLALDLALSVATGRSIFGDHEAVQGDVLYLALEDTPRRLNKRMKLLTSDFEDSIERLTIKTECPRQDEGGKKVIASWLQSKSIKEPKLVIIDTLFRFRPAYTLGGGYKNDALAVEWPHKLAQHTGISVVFVHHDIKSKTASWETAISGSKGLTGIVDGMMMLKKYRQKDHTLGLFYATSRDLEEVRYQLMFDAPHGRWIKDASQSLAESDNMANTDLSPAMIAVQEVFILAPEENHTNQEVIKETGLPDGTVKASLSYLARTGFIKRVARGVYRLAPSNVGEG